MADQDYPDQYAKMEASVTRVANAAVAYEKTLGGTKDDVVDVNGYGQQPTIAKRVNDRVDEVAPAEVAEQVAPFKNQIDAATFAVQAAQPRSLLQQLMPWAVIGGGNNRPALGVRADGVAHAVLDQMPGLSLVSDYRWVAVGTNGVVVMGMKWSGEMVFYPTQASASAGVFVWNEGPYGARDVWAMVKGLVYQLTSQGDNADPHYDNGVINYVSRFGNVAPVQLAEPTENAIAPYVGQILHLIYTGQSLQCGINAGAAVTTQPLAVNRLLTIKDGVQLANEAGTLTTDMVAPFVPLVASIANKEPPCLQAASYLARNRGLPANAALLTSMHGRGAQGIQTLNKGSVPYNNSLVAVTASKAEADRLGLPYRIPFVGWNQGQHDGGMAQGVYLGLLNQLQADYQADLNAATGRNDTIPMLVTQMSNWTAPTYNRSFSWIPHEQLQACLDNPDKFMLAGPQYWLPSNSDGIHLPAAAYARDGIVVGQAAEAIINGRRWVPTLALAATRTGNKVLVRFNVPKGPLAIDTVNVTDPGNYGLRWIDSTNSATVTSVKLVGYDTLELTLSGVPTGTDPQVGIADIGIASTNAGPTTGPRSCIRDSANMRDRQGLPIYNWACHQRIAVVSN